MADARTVMHRKLALEKSVLDALEAERPDGVELLSGYSTNSTLAFKAHIHGLILRFTSDPEALAVDALCDCNDTRLSWLAHSHTDEPLHTVDGRASLACWSCSAGLKEQDHERALLERVTPVSSISISYTYWPDRLPTSEAMLQSTRDFVAYLLEARRPEYSPLEQELAIGAALSLISSAAEQWMLHRDELAEANLRG